MADNEKIYDSEEISPEAGALVRLTDQPPTLLPAVIQNDLVPFPGPIIPLLLETDLRKETLRQAKANAGFLVLINRATSRRGPSPSLPMGMPFMSEVESMDGDFIFDEEPEGDNGGYDGDEPMAEMPFAQSEVSSPVDLGELMEEEDSVEESEVPKNLKELCRVGILARVVKVFRLPDGRTSALLHLMKRAQPMELVETSPVPMVRVSYPSDLVMDTEDYEATYRQVRLVLQEFFEAHPSVSEEVKMTALSVEEPGMLADFVAQHLSRDFKERLSFLVEVDISERMRLALEVAIRELEMLNIGNRISQEIRDKVEKHQRDFLLREQLKAIRVELGEERDPTALAIEELKKKLDKAGLPEMARLRADEELSRLSLIPAESPEHNLLRSYLEWIGSLPWSTISTDNMDIHHAREVLDEDHYGLEEVKDRIIEFLAVRQLNPDIKGSILCFAGPPGVGKTSLGQSIARALGREFYRFSVGGMRDEAEIKGHRRTYVGAMPGRLLQALRQVKVANPVIMLDELDKMGSDWRGDPSSAMLEVLDPAQNVSFLDHYLDLPFDLSRVMFIATANIKTSIPGPLLDRLEIINLPGYIAEEKLEIAHRYLVPRQRKEHGLRTAQIRVGKGALRRMIKEYTHEAGVRELERVIGKVHRKRATEVVQQKKVDASIKAAGLEDYLGVPKMRDDRLSQVHKPGVATGLAWTPVGGTVLFIEAAQMPGKGLTKVTGQLGEVMTESTSIAYSYVRHQADELGLDPEIFSKHDVHLHFPAGAIPKDGPSAGITVTTAILSLITGTSVAPKLAMTGEISLGGEVLPVGGVREKVIAARSMGVTTVIVPKANEADVEEIPEEVRARLKFVFAASYDDVLPVAFPKGLKGVAKDVKARVGPGEGSSKKRLASGVRRKKSTRKSGTTVRDTKKRVARDTGAGKKR